MKASSRRARTMPAATAIAQVRMVSVAELPTRFGEFRAVAFTADDDGNEHLAIVRGHVRAARNVSLRVHSECLTGDVIGSLRCDCRDQLESSLETLGSRPAGILLYLRQEGRGIGLANKIRAYALQDRGHDTVEANHLLGFGDDERDYVVAADMLRALGVHSVKLMTNNPRKIVGLREQGVRVTGRIPLVATVNRFNASYLLTKQKRSGHWLGIVDGTSGGGTAPARTVPEASQQAAPAAALGNG
jgi:GTP cyclohydrolase II